MVCRGPNLALFTLNGAFLLEHAVCAEDNATVSSCAFYEGQGNEYLERNLIFTGHHHGVVRVSDDWKPRLPFSLTMLRFGIKVYDEAGSSWSIS